MTFKRIVSVLMIGILLLSFTGCKNDGGESALVDEFIESEQIGEEIFGEKEEAEPEKEKDDAASEEKEEEPEEQPKEEEKPEQKPADPVPEKEEDPEPEQEETKEPEPDVQQKPEVEEEESDQQGGPFYTAEENPYKDSLKVLAIGNSFSVDGMEYLWDIANSMGVKEVVLGNMYIGGCSLDTHYSNMVGNTPAYRYYKNEIGKWDTTADVAISTALKDEKWDIITLQQASGENFDPNSYKNLQNILQYIEQRKPQKDTKLLWHMTWAYQADSNRQALMDYGNNQIKMYEGVLDRIRNDVLIYDDFDGVIPVGTTIQNLRTTSVGDTLTRDGYHLSKGLGRYTAALTWYCYITGAKPEDVPFTPMEDQSLILRNHENICKSVAQAIENPYELMQ